MRRAWMLMALCALPVGATAQTWTPPAETYIVGNTLVSGAPMLVASGKGHGPSRGGGAPSPAPSPSPAPASSFSGSESRGESGFTFQPPLRVQLEPLTTPLYTPPSAPAASESVPLTVQATGPATLTIPVQVLFRLTHAAQAEPSLRQRLCNMSGQCIQWP